MNGTRIGRVSLCHFARVWKQLGRTYGTNEDNACSREASVHVRERTDCIRMNYYYGSDAGLDVQRYFRGAWRTGVLCGMDRGGGVRMPYLEPHMYARHL